MGCAPPRRRRARDADDDDDDEDTRAAPAQRPRTGDALVLVVRPGLTVTFVDDVIVLPAVDDVGDGGGATGTAAEEVPPEVADLGIDGLDATPPPMQVDVQPLLGNGAVECRYFRSPGGCRQGRKCRFAHFEGPRL